MSNRNANQQVVNLRRIRRERELSQAEVGRRANTAGGVISQFERGLRCTPEMLQRLAAALGVEASELTGSR